MVVFTIVNPPQIETVKANDPLPYLSRRETDKCPPSICGTHIICDYNGSKCLPNECGMGTSTLG